MEKNCANTLRLMLVIYFGLATSVHISEHDGRNCQNKQRYDTNATLLRLQALPGLGFDALRNLNMGQVFTYNFSTCRETFDGKFLVPDSVSAFPLKEVEYKFHAEVFEHWQDYKSLTSSNINAGIPVFGKFSTEIKEVRKKEELYNTITARTTFRKREYEVKLDVMSELHPAFKSRVYEIASYAQREDIRMAAYLSEKLVKDYGTHYITSVDVGAMLVKMDYLSRSYLDITDKTNISVTASLTFPAFELISKIINASGASSNEASHMESYRRHRMKLDVFTVGGAPFNPTFNMTEWLAEIPNNLVVVDRQADQLHGAIIPSLFPELPPHTTNLVSYYVQNATQKYIDSNKINEVKIQTVIRTKREKKGEVAGVSWYKNISYAIGGILQSCESSSSDRVMVSRTSEVCNLGLGKLQASLLYQYTSSNCGNLKLKWCTIISQSHSTEMNTYLFGGYYSSQKVNPVTGSKSCKPYFQDISLLFDRLHICLSSDYELAMPNAILFGGFFSRGYGNPLAIPSYNGSNHVPWPYKCPNGYTAHHMITFYNIEIHVCLESDLFSTPSTSTPMDVKLPPFTDINKYNGSKFHSDTLQVQGSGGITLTRNPRGKWESTANKAGTTESCNSQSKGRYKRPL